MRFSVITPFYNESSYIRDCMDSILAQDMGGSQYETLFVDNGSTDGSDDIVKRSGRVRYLLETGFRAAHFACNTAIQEAVGEIIAFTDADCIVPPDWLSNIGKTMDRTGASILIGETILPVGERSPLRLFQDYENDKIEYVLGRLPKKYFFGCSRNMAVRSSVFKELGPFVEAPVLGDTELVQRCANSPDGLKISFAPSVKITHMEITRLSEWYAKIYNYGINSRHPKMPIYRPLNMMSKIRIYYYCSRKRKYGPARALLLLMLLMAGDLVFKAGRIRSLIFAGRNPEQKRADISIRFRKP